MSPTESAIYKPAGTFKLWQPGPMDAFRSFLLSERLQSATQLAVGVLFVSLFVFVEPLRFPNSCVAILLYFVVAVTGAPDCHVGTRIFLCGFMLGPLTLALPLGGIIATLSKLAPTAEGRLVVLCVLGPLALIPFAVNRMGTSHLYLFAMGMVSCMYLGMPILTGWGAPDIATLWERGVGFILVAAMIGMFAGSALSIVVVPSLASHQLEQEVSTALKLMGQHLSGCASHLWRPGKTNMQALPSHLQGLHPLLVPSAQAAQPGEVVPGLLDRDFGAAVVSPRQVYIAAMDWFEHLSRPPSDSNAHPNSCFQRCGSASTAGSGRSELLKNTFYGPEASRMAAAVAAAAMDSQEEQQWQQQLSEHSGLQQQDVRSSSWAPARHLSTNGQPVRQQHSMSAQHPLAAGAVPEHPASLRLGSTVTSAHVAAAKADVLQDNKQPWHTAEGRPVGSAQSTVNMQLMPGERVVAAAQPGPLMSEARQLLAHANQILEASGAEPGWLRHGERRFRIKPWTKLVSAAQLVALRVKALDLIQRDFVSLSEEPHSFPVTDDLSQLLQQLYGSAAAALAMLSEQVRCRDKPAHSCAANEHILQRPAWRESRQRLLDALKATLAQYYLRVQQASPDQPVIIPSAHWVRRLMFFYTTTLSVMDALDGLGAAAEAALATPQQQHSSRHGWWPCCQQQHQQDPQKGRQQVVQQQEQQAPSAAAAAAAAAAHDIEAGVKGSTLHQASQGRTDASSGTVEAAGKPTPATLQTFTSMQTSSSMTAAAAATAAAAVNADIAAGPLYLVQQPQQPHVTLDPASQASQLIQQNVGPEAAAASAAGVALPGSQQQVPSLQQQEHIPKSTAPKSRMRKASDSVKASFKQHTAWMVPWLPMALNVKQYENLKLVAKQLPAAFSSRKAFLASLKKRSVQAVLKYWSVLTLLMVGTLVLMYKVPIIGRFNPSFGFTAAAVGMSARVESTLFKIAVWTGATIAGAAIGWAIMATPSMAFNSVAICAVVCVIAFCVGAMDRGQGNSSGLLALFTLTTIASIVLCQCCGKLGVTWVSVIRGASVLVAAVIALAVQNLVLPWYTSTWALEQLGLVYKEATEVLADMVCQLYEDMEELLQQYEVAGSSSSAGCSGDQAEGAAAAKGTPATNLEAVDEHSDAAAASSSAPAALLPMQRLRLLDDAVRKVWIAEQQQQQQQSGSETNTSEQQQQQRPATGQSSRSFSAAASSRLASLGHTFTGSASLEDLLQPSRANLAAETLSQGLAAQPTRSSSAGGGSCTTATSREAAEGAAAAVGSLQGDGPAARHDAGMCEMLQLLRQRRLAQQQQQQGSGQQEGSRRVGVTGLQLQSRLVRPLVQVKISLVLDTTAWTSGPLATPPLVLQMLRAMFDLVDALAALQQAESMPVKGLSGSWDWMLLRVAGAWAALLLQVMQLADATATHLLGPSTDTSAALLTQIQEVQHQRFLFFALLRELRVLLHTALVTDDVVGAQFDSIDESHLQGHLRYSACVYATGKVLDQVTAAARCALSVSK